MSGEDLQQRSYVNLRRRVGPHAVAFVEYVCRELWPAARRIALDAGLNPKEAEDVARSTAAGAVKGMRSAMNAAARIRELGGGH